MWIAVKDKLPEVAEGELLNITSPPVLVYRAKFKKIGVATYESWDDGETFSWKTDDSEQWDITEEVTYWQALPAPPEAGE